MVSFVAMVYERKKRCVLRKLACEFVRNRRYMIEKMGVARQPMRPKARVLGPVVVLPNSAWFQWICHRRLQRDVFYLGWPIAPSCMSPNAGGCGRGELRPCGISANEYSCIHRSTNKLWRSNSYLTYALSWCNHWMAGAACQAGSSSC